MTLAASVGGLKAPSYILAGLPADFPASVLVIQRHCPYQPTRLADILSRRTALRVKQTMDGDVQRPATVFDRRPLVRPDGAVSRATRMQCVRPLSDFAFALRMLAGRLGGW